MRKIGLISVSSIPDDPRVRRQGDLLHSAGYEIVAVGLPGSRSVNPDWLCIEVSNIQNDLDEAQASTQPRLSQFESILRRAKAAHQKMGYPLRRIFKILSFVSTIKYRIRRTISLIRVHLNPIYATNLYWDLNNNFAPLYQIAKQQQVDFWIANDWTTIPIVMRLKQENGTPFGYDTHELAIDEYAHKPLWRLTQRPIISALEQLGIREAQFVTCVSEGISDRLNHVYKLHTSPTVIRNMPNYTRSDFRPVGKKINVLYHGIVSQGRALEEIIKSVRHWHTDYYLTIRGPSSSASITLLRSIA